MNQISIWWIRRDMRLEDNQALKAALEAGEFVVPVFILDPALLNSPKTGEKRLAFLYEGLRELDVSLRQRGSYLVLRQGPALEELAKLRNELGFNQIFAERDFSPYARKRDSAIGDALPLTLVDGLTIHHPDMPLKADNTPYSVFTPFKRRWLELPLAEANSLLTAPLNIPTPSGIESLEVPKRPSLPDSVPFPPGEVEAHRRLSKFIQAEATGSIYQYGDQRNRLDLSGTSGLSPYLRFGMLSARQAVTAAIKARSAAEDKDLRLGPDTWLSELIWREFYISILFHYPEVLKRSFRPAFNHINWRNKESDFIAWCDGQTGYPVIDAAMRQLSQTGWMHNRARMLVASFLVKDLLVDWRWGERWFMQHLIDGDPAANNGGWQWTAGTGTDAAPYFRIFNPSLQGKKFDPNGQYVRSWLPELQRVTDRYIHEPWKMDLSVQQESGCIIGQHYPHPIVDHRVARQATLDAFAQAREEYDQGK
jgi:deoxyribodipyrimidine photo-lyase